MGRIENQICVQRILFFPVVHILNFNCNEKVIAKKDLSQEFLIPNSGHRISDLEFQTTEVWSKTLGVFSGWRLALCPVHLIPVGIESSPSTCKAYSHP